MTTMAEFERMPWHVRRCWVSSDGLRVLMVTMWVVWSRVGPGCGSQLHALCVEIANTDREGQK